MKLMLQRVEQEIENRNISEKDIANIISSIDSLVNRRIIGGYASVNLIDREGHRIPLNALRDASKDFMDSIYFRSANIFHSDVQVGRVLPYWTDPESGKTFLEFGHSCPNGTRSGV